jgi:uncharacterized membrane protein YeaQ/YmgE (transglycosylase-associated protein family)
MYQSITKRKNPMRYSAPLIASVALLATVSPALAQSDDAVVEQGAGIIAWIFVGLIGGFLASKVVNKTGEGTFRDIVLGIIGGIVGGAIFRAIGGHGVTGFNVGSIVVAFVGAIVVLFIYHAVAGRK